MCSIKMFLPISPKGQVSYLLINYQACIVSADQVDSLVSLVWGFSVAKITVQSLAVSGTFLLILPANASDEANSLALKLEKGARTNY